MIKTQRALHFLKVKKKKKTLPYVCVYALVSSSGKAQLQYTSRNSSLTRSKGEEKNNEQVGKNKP